MNKLKEVLGEKRYEEDMEILSKLQLELKEIEESDECYKADEIVNKMMKISQERNKDFTDKLYTMLEKEFDKELIFNNIWEAKEYVEQKLSEIDMTIDFDGGNIYLADTWSQDMDCGDWFDNEYNCWFNCECFYHIGLANFMFWEEGLETNGGTVVPEDKYILTMEN